MGLGGEAWAAEQVQARGPGHAGQQTSVTERVKRVECSRASFFSFFTFVSFLFLLAFFLSD